VTTRENIASEAQRLFEEHGYDATSVRTIAAAAAIDPAQVIRYFGSKEELFAQVMSLQQPLEPVLNGPRETLGERLVMHALSPEQNRTRRVISALLRASDRESVQLSLRLTLQRMFVDQVLAELVGSNRELRAELISTQVIGLIQSWAIVEEPRLTGADMGSIVRLYGAAIQMLVEGE
jgi:AcrR family transcriptional regulator